MVNMTIKAPYIYNADLGKVVESTENITISLGGDTYEVREQIKAMGFNWDGDSKEWYHTANRKWFKANGYAFVRSVAKELKCHPDIIGVQAKMAVQSMDK